MDKRLKVGKRRSVNEGRPEEKSKTERLGEFLNGDVARDGNILAQLASRIISDVIIKGSGSGNRVLQWNSRVTDFFRSRFSSVPKNHKEINQARNNLNRTLARKQLTWQNFMTIVRMTKARKVRFVVELEDALGRVTTVDIEIPNQYGEDDNVTQGERDEA